MTSSTFRTKSEIAQTSEADKFCTIGETRLIVGSPAKSTIYGWIDKGQFPRPYRIGIGRVAWSYRELQEWIADRKLSAPR